MLSGCATKKYVSGEVEKSSAKSELHISDVESQVEQTQTKVNEHEQRLQQLDRTTRTPSPERAKQEAQRRKVQLFDGALGRQRRIFPVNGHELSDEAKQQLDDFVEKLKTDDKNVYIEIQGHTDSTGNPQRNMQLGQERADAVRLYLNQKGVALNRMSTISYGRRSRSTPTAPRKAGRRTDGLSSSFCLRDWRAGLSRASPS